MGWLERYASPIYALLRIVAGALFACHGAQKLLGAFGGVHGGGGGGSLPPLLMAAGCIELLGGILIAVGFFAGIAAFICSGQMAVAYFMVHQPQGPLPIENKGELAVVYCFLFLYIAARGSGVWSIDGARKR